MSRFLTELQDLRLATEPLPVLLFGEFACFYYSNVEHFRGLRLLNIVNFQYFFTLTQA